MPGNDAENSRSDEFSTEDSIERILVPNGEAVVKRVKRVNYEVDFHDMTALMQRMMDDMRKLLSIVSMEGQKTYKDIVKAIKPKIYAALVDERKKMENHFQVESATFAISSRDKLLRQFSDVQRFRGKSSALFRGPVVKVLDAGSSSTRSTSVGAEKSKRPRKAAGLKGGMKPAEVPSIGKNNINVDLVRADTL